jgi:hypothetical protein
VSGASESTAAHPGVQRGMMMRQCRRGYGLLALFIVWALVLASCQPTVLGPTTPSGYHVVLPEASQTTRSHPLPLTVRVSDAAGQPVDEVLVQFRIPESWATRARVDPPTVATRQGRATTTLRARAPGQLMVQITVEDRTVDIPITIVGDTPRF